MNDDMGVPQGSSQGGADLADLWPSLNGLLGPASLQLWAWALAQYGQRQGGPVGQPGQGVGEQASLADAASQGDAADWAAETPPNHVWADAVETVGRAPSGASQGPVGGAVPASSIAVPASATVPTSPMPTGGPAQPPGSILNPGGQFLRPELSGGPDKLVAALAGDRPNDNPFGFVVDPNTGSVSRWRADPTSDPAHPRLSLQPVGPQEKQSYLEWRTGARANYPLGQISPEERGLRQMQAAGLLPGAGPDVAPLLLQISQGEGTSDADARARGLRSGYDIVYEYGKYGMPHTDLTNMTLADVDELQTRMKDAQRKEFARQGLSGKLPTSAVGKYQFTQDALHDLEKEFRLTGAEKFTSALQEAFARRLLERHGIQEYVRGQISADALQNRLRPIWSSIEAPGATPSGKKLVHGTSTEDFRNALPKVQDFAF